jgi:cell division protease FtsH
MKFAAATIMGLLLAEKTSAFQAFSPIRTRSKSGSSSSYLSMAVDMPPAVQNDVPVIQRNQYGPTDVRYSDFLKLVNKDKIEKVTFSADGTQLLGVDVDGTRLKIEALPNDPELLSQLTTHKVRNVLLELFRSRWALLS